MIRSRSTPVTTDHGGLDRTGWIVLVIVFLSIFVLALDTTIVTVAVPTILREFDTNLPSVQWVITGYSLTFATFLIIGGRLGDVFGHRRVFAVGTALFGFGSFLAAISSSVAMLILGEAVIEGIGAALMLPATVAILSNRFTGAERATAFTAWGAATGTAVAFGPAVGGFLTTNFSWRWAFGINVVVAPLAILGALLFMKDGERTPGPRPQIDIGGAVLLATGMFLLVFGLSEGGTYGWLHSRARVVLGGVGIWPAGWALSVIPGAFLGALVVLTTFYFNQRGKERMGREALFEFGQLRHLGFRYGLLTTGGLAMGQHGMQFVLPVFLQDGLHLSAQRNGLWQLPIGITVIVAAQVGARLVRLVGPSAVVRMGLAVGVGAYFYIALVVSPSLTFLRLLPGLVLFGAGIGFATSQLASVTLMDIPHDKAGVASAASTTMRQAGASLSVAVAGSILSAQTIRTAVASVGASTVPVGLKAHTISALHQQGLSFAAPAGTSTRDAGVVRRLLQHALASGARWPLIFGASVMMLGAVASMLLPRRKLPKAEPIAVEDVATFDSLDVVPALMTEEAP